MVRKVLAIVVLIIMTLVINAKYFSEKPQEKIILGDWTEPVLNEFIYEGQEIETLAERIEFLSEKFLGNPYKANTLIGDEKTKETLVINFEAFDCITFLDHVLAMSLSRDFNDFKNKIRELRYKNSEVDFLNRNHFFSDWSTNNSKVIKDVTKEIGGEKTKSAIKNLNQKDDGSKYLPGLGFINREINYIEAKDFDQSIIDKLKTGDFIGYYSARPGLDVSHVGIIVKKDDGYYVRNASSKKDFMKVTDEKLTNVLKEIPGLVIYRVNN